MSQEGIEIIMNNYDNALNTFISSKEEFKYIDLIIRDFPICETKEDIYDIALDQYNIWYTKYKNNYNAKLMSLQDTTYFILRTYELENKIDFTKYKEPPKMGFKFGDKK